MHLLVSLCLVLAGLAYALGVWLRWRRPAADQQSGSGWAMWPGMALLTAAAILGLSEPDHGDFAWAVLGAWAAMAGIHFVTGWLRRPSLSLLALPVAALAMLLALGALAGGHHAKSSTPGAMHWTAQVHVLLMALHLGAALLAGGAGGLWLIARRQLKVPGPRALALPNLPVLERLTERTLVISAGLLAAGLAVGGAAMEASPTVTLAHPAVIIACCNLVVVLAALGLRATNRIGRRALAVAALQAMSLAMLSVVAIQLLRHA